MGVDVVLGGALDSIGLGAHNDNGEGVLRVKLAQGELVKVPLRASTIATASQGGAGAISNWGTAGANEDGTGNFVNLNVPPAALPTAAAAKLTAVVWGRQIGMRWQRDSSAFTAPTICVAIDGVVYSYTNSTNHAQNIQVGQQDTEALWLIADDLPDGPHTVEVIQAQDPANVTTYKLNVYGWIAEKRAGYEAKPRLGQFPNTSATALTTTATTIPNNNNAVGDVRGVRRLHFYNTDTVTRTVHLQFNGNDIKVFSLASLTHAEYDFGEAVALNSNWKWKVGEANTTTAVNGWVQGDI